MSEWSKSMNFFYDFWRGVKSARLFSRCRTFFELFLSNSWSQRYLPQKVLDRLPWNFQVRCIGTRRKFV